MRKKRNGATLPLVVFLLAGLLGAAALAIDLSTMSLARQRAQAVADAAALAGAASPASAGAASASVIAANNSSGAAFSSTSVTTGSGGSVTVAGTVNAPLSFAPAIGYSPRSSNGLANTLSVPAEATATMPSACSLPPGMPVAPFGLIGDDPANTDPAVAFISAVLSGAKTLTPGAYQAASTQVMLSLNLWDTTGKLSVNGSFDPLVTSGIGAGYQNTIRQLSDQALSAGQMLTTTPLAYDNAGLTQAGIAARLAPSNTQFTHLSATYDAWFNGKQEQTDAHLMLVPVISQSVKNRPGSVTIMAFATFFISQPVQNVYSNAIVYGRFIGLEMPGASGGACADTGDLTPPRLIR
ncbi:MAG: pilus assembly protein TadG-related protein [Janthinobacterium lividum]